MSLDQFEHEAFDDGPATSRKGRNPIKFRTYPAALNRARIDVAAIPVNISETVSERTIPTIKKPATAVLAKELK
jgi:hypothetical protein